MGRKENSQRVSGQTAPLKFGVPNTFIQFENTSKLTFLALPPKSNIISGNMCTFFGERVGMR